jgi:hypothetical protein
MNRVDEQLLARLREETEREGLVFRDGIDDKAFDAVMDRLAKTPPLPKQQRKRRKRSTKHA